MSSELDDLIGSLGGTTESKPAANASATNELDDLMASLDTGAPAKEPAKETNELDDLMASLDTGAHSTSTAPPPPPIASEPAESSELSSLMDSLGNVPPVSAAEPAEPIQETLSDPVEATGVSELDDLLSGDVDKGVQPPTTAPPVAAGTLDDVLSGLETEMQAVEERSGVKKCMGCGKEIVGAMLQAISGNWHQTCFNCAVCSKSLVGIPFFEKDGKAHCNECYQELFCVRCAACSKPITDSITTAVGKSWHARCFVCRECGQEFPGGSFFEKEGQPYCQKCHSNLFAPRCAGCNEPILGEIISALNVTWHREHFVCAQCGCSFASGSFFEHESKPYCDVHYKEIKMKK